MTAPASHDGKTKPEKRALSPRQLRRRAEKLRKGVRRRKNARHG